MPPRMRALGLDPRPVIVGFDLARSDHSLTLDAHPVGWLLIEMKPFVFTGMTRVAVDVSVIWPEIKTRGWGARQIDLKKKEINKKDLAKHGFPGPFNEP